MSVAGLLTELARPEYAGLSDKEIVAKLNEWQTTYVPCAASSLAIKFAELLLPSRVSVAFEKGTIDADLFGRWELLLKFSESDPKATVTFNTPPLFIESLFDSLASLEVITATELIWLLDLGRYQRTAARKVFQKDVDEIDLTAARERDALLKKIEARRAEIVQMQADIQAAHNELQKRDDQGRIVGDKDFVPKWEK